MKDPFIGTGPCILLWRIRISQEVSRDGTLWHDLARISTSGFCKTGPFFHPKHGMHLLPMRSLVRYKQGAGGKYHELVPVVVGQHTSYVSPTACHDTRDNLVVVPATPRVQELCGIPEVGLVHACAHARSTVRVSADLHMSCTIV